MHTSRPRHLIQIGSQNSRRQISQLVVLQVHQHEGEVMQDIDTGNLVTELNAVEQGRPPFEQADVRQSHIAMAAPHASIAAPSVQLCRQLIEQGQLVPVECLHRVSIEQCAPAAQLR